MNHANETTVLHRIMLAVTEVGSRLFRNQAGRAWHGKVERITRSGTYPCTPGDVILRNARMVATGLCVGSSDLIGWTSKTVTPEMLGTRIAVFTALEVKVPGVGRTSDEQFQFHDQVKQAGGIAGIVDNHITAADVVVCFRTSGIRT